MTTITVRFTYWESRIGRYSLDVSYSWPGRVPVEGERIEATGSDPEMPEMLYTVKRVTWVVGERGFYYVMVWVEPQDADELLANFQRNRSVSS